MNTSEPPQSAGPGEEPTHEEIMSALFANMVIQNHNMAAMFLGRTPHPQTGQPIKDLDSAQMFVDQLEMLAYKTRGNLNNDEKQLLAQSLTQLRMAFVEELRRAGLPVPDHISITQKPEEAMAPAPATPPAPAPQAPPPPPAPVQAPAPASAAPAAPAPEPPDESRKRFTKKY